MLPVLLSFSNGLFFAQDSSFYRLCYFQISKMVANQESGVKSNICTDYILYKWLWPHNQVLKFSVNPHYNRIFVFFIPQPVFGQACYLNNLLYSWWIILLVNSFGFICWNDSNDETKMTVLCGCGSTFFTIIPTSTDSNSNDVEFMINLNHRQYQSSYTQRSCGVTSVVVWAVELVNECLWKCWMWKWPGLWNEGIVYELMVWLKVLT